MTVYVVTTDADSGAGSLRNALAAAQTGDVIEFSGSLDDSTITLQSSLTIADGVTIDGGGDKITISGDDKYTDFIVSNFGAGGPATLEGLTIADGDGVGSNGAAAFQNDPGGNGGDAAGGVMLSSGSLNLVDDAFNNDTATGGAGGAAHDTGGGFDEQPAGNGGNAAGAIYVEPAGTIAASGLTFSNDTATAGQPGAPFPGEVTETAGDAYPISNIAAYVDPTVFTVTTDADSGAGSLRAALAQAATYVTIIFAPSLDNSTITLQSSLTIAVGVTIDGVGDNITISGADKYTDFIVANAGASAPVTLEGLTIANGDGVGSAGAAGTSNDPGGNGGDAAGGVMLSSGSLDLFDDAFNNDTATGGAGGAAWSPANLGKPGQAAGNGGNAAGAVYVEAGATVWASNLAFSNDTADPGPGGAEGLVNPAGSPGVAYNITNDVAAESGVYIVTTDADSGVGSLRYALTEPQTGEIIKFASALDGQTITLQSSLTIANGDTIDGLGDDITISGADKYADFIVSNAGAGAPATMEGLTIADGNGVGSTGAGATVVAAGGNGGDAAGGLWLSDGAVNLVNDAFNNDTATGGAGGASSFETLYGGHAAGNGGNAAGAIYVEAGATVTATDLTFSGDTANAGQPGSNASGGGAGSAGAAYAISNTPYVDSGVYTVTTDADSGLGSLRAILAEAQTGDWIKFASSLDNSTITLQSSLTIADGVTIDGFGDNIAISGDDKDTDFIVANAGAGASASLEGLITANGGLDLSSGAVNLYYDAFNGGVLTFASSAEAGTFSLGAGSRLIIDGGDTLSLSGTNSLSGSVSGAGTLALTGGTTTFGTGAALSTAAWSLPGAGTSATLNENLGYSGTFSEAAGDTLDLAGGSLTLTGSDTFAGGTLDGSNRLYAQGTTLITDGLTIAGTASLENQKTLTQSGGAVTVGDDAGNKAELYNASTGTYAIADDSGIGRGSSTVSFIVNAGIFKKTGGTGTSAIAASFSDTGTVTVSSGTLSFSGPTNSFAAAITGAGTVLFAGGSTALESGASASVAALSETGAGTALTIAENLSYGGAFAEGAGSTLSVGSGDALTLTGTTILAGTTSGAGALDLSGGGSASIDSGAKISVSAWSLLGSKTSATLNENLSYAGTFGEAASDTLDLAGGSLTLTGSDTFSGGTLNGSNRLYAQGTTLITDGLTIGGTASLENQKTLTQSGGAVTVGDNAGNKAELYNASTGTYAIADDSGIGRGSSTVSFIVNSGLFEKTGGTLTSAIAASFTDTGTVTVVSGTLSFSGPSNSFAGAITGAGTVLFAGGSTSLKSSASASVDGLSETGAGTTLTIAENFSYGGVFTEGAGSTLVVDSGDTLTLTGTTTLAGTTSGAGTLDLSGGGSSSIDSGAKISVSAWSLLGSKTGATLDENLGYAGTFGEAAGDTFDLAGGSLTLTGADTFAGGTIDGSNRLYAQGTTLITDGLTIGGTASLENQKTVTQSGGAVTVGDNAGNKAELYNASTGTYAIADDSGIGRGSSTASFIVNAGMFEKTGGTATSAIAPALTNTGTVLVSSGVLDLQGAVSGTGADTISGASTLEFDSTVASGQTIGFTGAGGTLDLGDPQGFSGAISGFDTVGSNDTLEIAAPWTYLSFSENTAGTQGTLTLANGASHISLTLLGDYTAANIVHKAGPGGSTLVTYT